MFRYPAEPKGTPTPWRTTGAVKQGDGTRGKGTDVPTSTLHSLPQKPDRPHQSKDSKEKGTKYLVLCDK